MIFPLIFSIIYKIDYKSPLTSYPRCRSAAGSRILAVVSRRILVVVSHHILVVVASSSLVSYNKCFRILIFVIFTVVVVRWINLLLSMTIIRPPFKPQPRSTTALSPYCRLARLLVSAVVSTPVNIQYKHSKVINYCLTSFDKNDAASIILSYPINQS